MIFIIKIFIVLGWFGVIYRYGSPNEKIDSGEVYDGIPSEYFGEKMTDEEIGPSGIYKAFYHTQFTVFYLLLYFLFMGQRFQWVTWKAWFALLITCVVIYWNQVRSSPEMDFSDMKKPLMQRVLVVSFAHIALCILLIIF